MHTNFLIVGLVLIIVAVWITPAHWFKFMIAAPRSYWRKIQEAQDIVALIDELRGNPGCGHIVGIVADNDDPQTKEDQCAIVVAADWTFWNEETFYGETIVDALQNAMRARLARAEESEIGRRVKL